MAAGGIGGIPLRHTWSGALPPRSSWERNAPAFGWTCGRDQCSRAFLSRSPSLSTADRPPKRFARRRRDFRTTPMPKSRPGRRARAAGQFAWQNLRPEGEHLQRDEYRIQAECREGGGQQPSRIWSAKLDRPSMRSSSSRPSAEWNKGPCPTTFPFNPLNIRTGAPKVWPITEALGEHVDAPPMRPLCGTSASTFNLPGACAQPPLRRKVPSNHRLQSVRGPPPYSAGRAVGRPFQHFKLSGPDRGPDGSTVFGLIRRGTGPDARARTTGAGRGLESRPKTTAILG